MVHAGSVVVAHGRSCWNLTCGIFLGRGSNSCLLHWQVDSFFFFVFLKGFISIMNISEGRG